MQIFSHVQLIKNFFHILQVHKHWNTFSFNCVISVKTLIIVNIIIAMIEDIKNTWVQSLSAGSVGQKLHKSRVQVLCV